MRTQRLLSFHWENLALFITMLLLSTLGATSDAQTHYVALDNPSPAAPYTSWATAATNIQDAIDAAGPGATVLVSNGVFEVGGRTLLRLRSATR